MTLDDILTLVEAGDELGVSAETLRTQIRRGRFTARLLGKTWITTRQEVERYRREQLGQAGRPPAPHVFATIPWPSNMYPGVNPLQLLAFDADPAEEAIVEELARRAIDEGAWTIAEVWGRIRKDLRLRDGLVIGVTDSPPSVILGRRPKVSEPAEDLATTRLAEMLAPGDDGH